MAFTDTCSVFSLVIRTGLLFVLSRLMFCGSWLVVRVPRFFMAVVKGRINGARWAMFNAHSNAKGSFDSWITEIHKFPIS
jgi:hypothetical protein